MDSPFYGNPHMYITPLSKDFKIDKSGEDGGSPLVINSPSAPESAGVVLITPEIFVALLSWFSFGVHELFFFLNMFRHTYPSYSWLSNGVKISPGIPFYHQYQLRSTYLTPSISFLKRRILLAITTVLSVTITAI